MKKLKRKLSLKKPKFKRVGFVTVLVFLMDLAIIGGLVVINTKKFKTF